MYIKQIIISGFKSYGQKTIVEFDAKHNVIVGTNGSGKSNLFLAIQFVLSREFISLRENKRLDLLNKNSGIRSAFVEIIFDNSDKQLPIDKKSVSVKRMISLKTDQFFLNGETISATDISHFLESAGFSKSNPYYIVKQGKISKFTLTSEMRLKLLHEVAGTQVYRDYKKYFLTTIYSIKIKMEEIQNLLNNIDEKESSLKEDVKDLKEYKKLKKEHCTVQLVICNQIINKNTSTLEKLEGEANNLKEHRVKLGNKLHKFEEEINKSNKEFKKCIKEVENIKDEKKALKIEQEKLLTEKNKIYFTITDLNEDIKKDNENHKKIDDKLQELNNLINEKEKKLQKIKFEYDKKLIDEEEIKRKLDLDEQKRKELCKKQGRGSQFKSKEERDLWIKQELKHLEKQIADKKSYKIKIEQEIDNDKKEYEDLEKKIEELEKIKINNQKKIQDFRVELDNLNIKKDELLMLRKNLYKENKNYSDKLTSLKENVANLEKKLNSIFGRSIFDGINSVQKVLETFKDNVDTQGKLAKYCGLVIENFNCKSYLYKAVEETAGRQLFYHIVETRKCGEEILNEINRQHLPGEVTFLPLDFLKIQFEPYPQVSESKPLIDCLDYDTKYKNPLRKIFGKTLLCKNLEVAEKISKIYKLNGVTLQGDKVTSVGWITGGHNPRSPMDFQREIIDTSKEISLLNEKLNHTREKIQQIDNDISTCINGDQNIQVKINKTSDIIADLQFKINIMKKELDSINALSITKKNSLKECEVQLNAMFASQKSLNDELGQNIIENLSWHDQQLLENLNDSITQLKMDLRKMFDKITELECEKNKLEKELSTNLITQKNELIEIQKIMIQENKHKSLNLLNDKLKRKKLEISENMEYIKKLDEKVNELNEQKKEINSNREKLQYGKMQLSKDLSDNTKQLEKIDSKIEVAKTTISKNIKKKSKLAIPSNDLYVKFNEKSHEELFKMLHRINEKLKSYNQISEKVLDQYNILNMEREALHKRKEKIETAYMKIQNLINVLEINKCEAIEFMFNQISTNFANIFKKIVPTGNAYLVMKTADDVNNQNDTETATESLEEYDNLIGMDIRASFTGSVNKEINQLSGGQKSLLALTLIFAIQKCDPAPLYLFDEIDQALDFSHREAVAKMIFDRDETAQLFIITFRPEFLQHANKLHYVKFKNNTSHIKTVTREEATAFLNNR